MSLVVAILVSASVCIALRSARLRRHVVNDSPTSSVSPQKSTTLYLNTREELAQFVSDLQSPENDWRSIMTIRPDSYVAYFAFSVINGSSVHVLRVCLSRRLLTSLTLQELRFWESELQQAVRERNGSPDGSPLLIDDAKCLNCGMYFNGAQGYCDWCGSADSICLGDR